MPQGMDAYSNLDGKNVQGDIQNGVIQGYLDGAGAGEGTFSVPYLSNSPVVPVNTPRHDTSRVKGRLLSASREDRVLRLLLTEPQSWDRLNGEEHMLLNALPAPHGPLFVWLESHLHEYGPQPWAALRQALRGHPFEKHAIAQLTQVHEGIESDWSEVRSILNQLTKLDRQREMSELALRMSSDSAAKKRYMMLTALLKNA